MATKKTDTNNQAPAAGAKEESAPIDWDSIELHYRAGKRTLESIGKEFGVSKGRISQVAKKEGWVRDLQPKIEQRAKDKVAREVADKAAKQEALNDPTKQAVRRLGEAAVVEANASIVASADLIQREDILLGLAVSRSHLQELATLSNPRFTVLLEELADAYDESGPGPSGAWKTDKANELYRYIISLPGRVKSAKEVAASHGVYIPLQRKVLRMDEDADKNESVADALLRSIEEKGL